MDSMFEGKTVAQIIEEVDKIVRPNVLYVNPADKKTITDAVPDLEKSVVIIEAGFVEKGRAVLMKREALDYKPIPPLPFEFGGNE